MPRSDDPPEEASDVESSEFVDDCWVVIAGGGTIGHLTPGVAAAEALEARGLARSAIHFVGSERGIEATRLPDLGRSVTLLPGRGIKRTPTLQNVGAVRGLVVAFWRALRLLRRLRPAVVLVTGGYASVACALAAASLRIPLVVAEQNAVPGLANRLAGRFAKACAVSFPDTDLPRAVLTGNPVRPGMLAVERSRDGAYARDLLGVGAGRTMILAFGGSLGARRVNDAVIGLRSILADRADLHIRHVVGDRDWNLCLDRTAPDDGAELEYMPVRYEDDMASCFAAADLVVSRAGASTCAELTAVGVPSVLVPLPTAPGDHQSANARVLADAGAAVAIPDKDFDCDRLAAEIARLLGTDGELDRMEVAARSLGRRDAAELVADLVLTHAARLPGLTPSPETLPPKTARSDGPKDQL